MYLILFLFLLLMITLLFCIVQNKTPYDQWMDDEAQETFGKEQSCQHHPALVK